MFLMKIINWISYNHELNSSEKTDTVKECVIQEPKSFDQGDTVNIRGDDHSSSSVGGDTSVLDFCVVLQKSSCEDSILNKEESKSSSCEDRKVPPFVSDSAFKKVQNLKGENSVSSDEKKLPSVEYSLATETITTNKRGSSSSIDEIEAGDNSVVKSDVMQSDVSNLSPFHKSVLEFKHRTTFDIQNKRSVFTQTEAKLGKGKHSSMIKNLYKPTLSSVPELEGKNKAFCLNRSATKNSTKEDFKYGFESVVYGALYVLGCCQSIPEHLVATMNSKFVLRKRLTANGLKEAFSIMSYDDEPISISPAKHFIKYPSHSPDRSAVVVAFKNDKNTDMFQIGRFEKLPIDFKVGDMNSLDKARNGVSRFACRILVHRETHEARVYAAAFDSSRSIFLGEGGITSSRQGKMDGFTTNGVLIMNPKRNFPAIWREVSVCGYIYPLRSPKVEAGIRPRLVEETNVLEDGTLIDLCGITLLWRTPDGLRNTPDEEYLSRLQSSLHKSVPECQFLTPNASEISSVIKSKRKKAYVYLSCGHVVGLTLSGNIENLRGWSCPVCRVIGPIAELRVGMNPGFYLDPEVVSHAFKPCGHAASFKTVKYWSSISIPDHRNIQNSLCPFCGVKLNNVSKFVKLNLPAE